ncbi:hypothetical protein [Komarekiella delphini-convector]|nr:hypothetical protein [Komarekiella delphini-convector]
MTSTADTPKDYKQNLFTLVYDGAIAKNEPGKVNIHPGFPNMWTLQWAS